MATRTRGLLPSPRVGGSSSGTPTWRWRGGSGSSLSSSLARRLNQPRTVWACMCALLTLVCCLYAFNYYRLLAGPPMIDAGSPLLQPPRASTLPTLSRLKGLLGTSDVARDGAGAPLRPPAIPHDDEPYESPPGAEQVQRQGRSGAAEMRSGVTRAELLRELARQVRQAPRNPMLSETNPLQMEHERQAHAQRAESAEAKRARQASQNQGRSKFDPVPAPHRPTTPEPVVPSSATRVPVAPATSVPAAAPSPPLRPMPILLFTYNRPANLRSTLQSILSRRPADVSLHPIFISQDGGDPATEAVAREFVENASGDPRGAHVHYMQFRWERSGVVVEPQHAQWVTYYKISTHYKWALGQLFDRMAEGTAQVDPALPAASFDNLILLEDDMHLSPDFFSYFRATAPLLDADPSLLCVSAWNDNGRPKLSSNPLQLHRTECFPGLGWLMSRRLWGEFGPKWPGGFWDDWFREPPQRAGRSCLFPEVNRVYTFGVEGSSGGQHYEQFLRGIRLNDKEVDWEQQDLAYVGSKDAYRAYLRRHISAATPLRSLAELRALPPPIAPGRNSASDSDSATAAPAGEYRLLYSDLAQLDLLLSAQNMMTDHKAGVPRTSFEGVLSWRTEQGRRVWVVPRESEFMQGEE